MRWRSAFSLWFRNLAFLGCVHREERFRPDSEEKEPKDFFLWTGSVCSSGRATSRGTGCIFITRPPARYRKKRNQKTFPVDRERLPLWQGDQPGDGVYLYHAASGQAGKETNRNSKPPSKTDGGFFAAEKNVEWEPFMVDCGGKGL